MRGFSTEAKVGILVIIGIVLLSALTLKVGNFHFGQKGYTVEVVFTSAAGLEDKAAIQIAGVRVGTVERVYLKGGLAHVVMRLDEDAVIREDSEISIASSGILGERHVEISSGSADSPAIEPNAVVTGRELVSIDKLISQLTDIAGDIKTVTGSLGELFGAAEGETQLGSLIENFNTMVKNINALAVDNRSRLSEAIDGFNRLTGDARGLIGDNREEITAAIANLRAFSETLNARTEELAGRLTGVADDLKGAVADGRGDLKAGLETIRSAARKAEEAADRLTAILRKVDEGEGTIGRLVNDPSTVERLDRALDEIGGVAGKINAGEGTLGKLVTDDSVLEKTETALESVNDFLARGESIRMYLGFRSEYITESAEAKNYATLKIQPRPEKYYLVEVVDDPAGVRREKTTETLFTSGGSSSQVTEEQTLTDQRLAFTVQFARVFGDFTIRGPLIESTGGFALDYHPFGDQLRLTVQGWDFSREDHPHVKTDATWQFHRDFFVTAGIDDWLVADRTSFFFGAGLLFSDDDLKYLLSLSSFGL